MTSLNVWIAKMGIHVMDLPRLSVTQARFAKMVARNFALQESLVKCPMHRMKQWGVLTALQAVFRLVVVKPLVLNVKQDCIRTKYNRFYVLTANLVRYRVTTARKEPLLPQNFLAPTVRIRTKTTQKVARFVPKACTNPNQVNKLALVARLVDFLPIKAYRRSTTTKNPIVKFVVPT